MSLERPGYYGIVLSLFLGDHLDDTIGRILGPLGTAIADIGAEIDKAASKFGPDADSWIDDEVGNIEELLGVAFVACQAQITSIVAGIQRLHKTAMCREEHAKKRRTIQLMTTDCKRAGIMQHGFAPNAGSLYSPIEVIDAFANYYKHSDQWSVEGVDWDKPETHGFAARTIAVTRFAGAEQGSTGNLRTGAEYLGNRKYQDTSVFSAHLSKWRKGLVDAYEAELKSKGLIHTARSEAPFESSMGSGGEAQAG